MGSFYGIKFLVIYIYFSELITETMKLYSRKIILKTLSLLLIGKQTNKQNKPPKTQPTTN